MVDLTGLKILIVDDSQTITRAAEIFLQGPKDKPTGIISKAVSDGFEAIPEIMSFMPHIMLLDVIMPRSNGFNICKAIKSNPKLSGIKVIILTSKDGLFDRARGVESGADDYMTKPFQRDEILQMMEKHVPLGFSEN